MMVSFAARATNAFPNLILRSPLHGLMSGKYAIVEFTGRKSGRRYQTPVAYVRDGDTVLLSTDSQWWRNLVGGSPVRIRIGSRMYTGTGTAVQDERESAAIIRRLVDAIPSYSRPAGLKREGRTVSDDEIARAAAEGRVGILIALETR